MIAITACYADPEVVEPSQSTGVPVKSINSASDAEREAIFREDAPNQWRAYDTS